METFSWWPWLEKDWVNRLATICLSAQIPYLISDSYVQEAEKPNYIHLARLKCHYTAISHISLNWINRRSINRAKSL